MIVKDTYEKPTYSVHQMKELLNNSLALVSFWEHEYDALIQKSETLEKENETLRKQIVILSESVRLPFGGNVR